MLEPMGVRVAGVGAYVPSQVMTNDELAKVVDTSDEWIASHSGGLPHRERLRVTWGIRQPWTA
jgi:3-oxoacyl-[acyl-carrier-protein] synthase III